MMFLKIFSRDKRIPKIEFLQNWTFEKDEKYFFIVYKHGRIVASIFFCLTKDFQFTRKIFLLMFWHFFKIWKTREKLFQMKHPKTNNGFNGF